MEFKKDDIGWLLGFLSQILLKNSISLYIN